MSTSDSWFVDYIDEHGIRQRFKASHDKNVAKQILEHKLAEVALLKHKLDLPKRQMVEVMNEYLAYRKSHLSKGAYAIDSAAMTRMSKYVGTSMTNELNESVLTGVVAKMSADGLSPRTIDLYIIFVKRSVRWAVEKGMMAVDNVSKFKRIGEHARRKGREVNANKATYLFLSAYMLLSDRLDSLKKAS